MIEITHQVCEVLRRLAAQVDSPRGIAVRILAQHNEWEQLQQLSSVAPSAYSDAEAYFRDVIVTDFARKSPPVKGDLHQTAVDTFWLCEHQNKVTNDRLDRFIGKKGPFLPSDLHVMGFIASWRKKIRKVLGRLPGTLVPRFSPGATVSDTRDKITIPHKMSQAPTLYPETLCLWPFIAHTAWGRINDAAPSVVRGNEFFSVPKDARKNRGCCKEASGNVTLQLAVGSHIRSRLMRFGIDLNQGQDLHRRLAREGSVDGSLATIDLSNASDTVACKLVQLLFPEDWYELLSSLRAPFTHVDGKQVKLEKFSSMGNGFTFELETLLFWTLAESCLDAEGVVGRAYCYGDDLIIPSHPRLERSIRATFRFFGFTPNEAKSFFDGPFRESCGGDYFNGQAVRPYYQKNYLNEPQEWFAMLNGLRALNRPVLTSIARGYALEQLPSDLRKLRGPSCLGDAVIHDKQDTWIARPAGLEDGWEGVAVLGYTPAFRTLPLRSFRPSVAHASALYGVPSFGVTPRGWVSGYKRTWIIVPFGAYHIDLGAS